ncbi:predicted protein [Nematostella vectensis]|uniref:CARD domain-containing protein n=1 Tax=Nematostella vectensis TaxID=45351 RepID=A7SZA5_NEMVE|nr:predicted protein [Nematostella vectensis]|eukprot:XP_001623058.1 predicted protein [Nematostella vectensis]
MAKEAHHDDLQKNKHNTTTAASTTMHLDIKECITFVTLKNPEDYHKVISKLKDFEEYGLDRYLLQLVRHLQHDLTATLLILRTCGVIDATDQQRITNKQRNCTTSDEIGTLVDVLNTKSTHAQWYLAHALKGKHRSLYEAMHGDIECCVCGEFLGKDVELASLGDELIEDDKKKSTNIDAWLMGELFKRESVLKERYLCLETKLNVMLERIRPLFAHVESFSHRFRAEIEDVLPPQESDKVTIHTNVEVLNRLKGKYDSFKRNGSFIAIINQQPSVPRGDQDCLQEVISKDPSKDFKETTPRDTTCDEAWLQIEQKAVELLAAINPCDRIKASVKQAKDFGKKHVSKCALLTGVSLCVFVYAPYLLIHGPWTKAPLPLYG